MRHSLQAFVWGRLNTAGLDESNARPKLGVHWRRGISFSALEM